MYIPLPNLELTSHFTNRVVLLLERMIFITLSRIFNHLSLFFFDFQCLPLHKIRN